MLRSIIAAAVLAFAPMSAFAQTPYPATVYTASALQFTEGSYCGAYVGPATEQFKKIRVAKGQRVFVTMDQPFLAIRNPQGRLMDMSEFRVDNSSYGSYSFEFNALHSGYYTLIPSDGNEYYMETMVVCTR